MRLGSAEWLGAAWLAIASLALGCGEPGAPPPPRSVDGGVELGGVELGGAIVARVDDEAIAAATVARIAEAQRLDPRAALERAVFDAAMAREARARGLDARYRVALTGALAESLLGALRKEAAASGPVTDQELDEALARHWFQLARPEGFRTVHAVVRLAEGATEADVTHAEGVADAPREVPPPAPTRRAPEDPAARAFIDAANAVDAEGSKVVVEPLPPVAADGMTINPEGRAGFDPAFVQAAVALEARGDVAGPVRSSFGWHVILLLERVPGVTLPREAARALVREEVLALRYRAAREAAAQPAEASVELPTNLDALLGLVAIEP